MVDLEMESVFEIFRDGIRKRGIEIVEEFTIIGFE